MCEEPDSLRHTGATSKPLPQIYCQKCYLVQSWRNQPRCLHCGRKLNEWHVKKQLRRT